MCLGVPGRLANWIDRDPLLAKAEIDFGGIRKPIHMACVPEANIGDYVLVHAGVALTVIDEQAALRLLDELSQMATPPEADRVSPPI